MRSQTTIPTEKGYRSLRRAMRSNGIFSALSGVTFLFAAKSLAAFLGLPSHTVLVGLAIVLILYAAVLFQVTSGPIVDRRLALAAVVLDIGWVIGSAAILIADWPALTLGGKWMVALLAEAVAFFAVWQGVALRRSTQ